MFDESLIDYFISLVKGYDFGDIRFCNSDSTKINIDSGEVRSVSKLDGFGFGIRILHNGVWGFASSTNMTKEAIKDSVERAYKIISVALKNDKIELSQNPEEVSLKPSWKIDPREIDISEKLGITMAAYKSTKINGVHGAVCNYSENIEEWMVGNTLGTKVSFTNSNLRLGLQVFVKDESATQFVVKTINGNSGFEFFDDKVTAFGADAAEEATHLIGAKPVKGGVYDVVLNPGMTGVYTHEAFGHASEADGIISGMSVLENKIGKKVGSEIVNIVDDPTIANARGSYTFDSEGTKAKKRVIVENGILKTYLHTLETASYLKMEPNGAARASGFSSKPIARMSNTFIAPSNNKEDIYNGVKSGVALFDFQYGYVSPESGAFTFKSQYGRMIKNGELGEYIRDVSLVGSTLDILNRVDMVGSDMQLDGGTCGKEGQYIPVTSGGPYIRIRGVVVGGQ